MAAVARVLAAPTSDRRKSLAWTLTGLSLPRMLGIAFPLAELPAVARDYPEAATAIGRARSRARANRQSYSAARPAGVARAADFPMDEDAPRNAPSEPVQSAAAAFVGIGGAAVRPAGRFLERVHSEG